MSLKNDSGGISATKKANPVSFLTVPLSGYQANKYQMIFQKLKEKRGEKTFKFNSIKFLYLNQGYLLSFLSPSVEYCMKKLFRQICFAFPLSPPLAHRLTNISGKFEPKYLDLG